MAPAEVGLIGLLALTYLGGSGTDDCDAIAAGPAGSVFLACHSDSSGFPAGTKGLLRIARPAHRAPAPGALPRRAERGPLRRPAGPHHSAAATGFVSVPIASIRQTATSPGFMNTGGLRAEPTPAGLPVEITSPGRSVRMFDA
jgi:hypothetical protein